MFESSQHQVAGHAGSLDFDYVFAKPAVPQEVEFYQTLVGRDLDTGDKEGPPVGNLLTDWTAQYYGTLTEGQIDATVDLADMLETVKFAEDTIAVEPSRQNYLVLSNLYHFFRKPSLLDVKLGAILHDENATPEKAERLLAVSKETTSGSLGFRMCGMKIFNPKSEVPDLAHFPNATEHVSVENSGSSDSHIVFNKWFGRALTEHNVQRAIELFFTHNLTGELLYRVLTNYHRRLQLLYNCILSYNIRIVSSSLLFILELDPSVLQEVSQNIDKYESYDPLVNELEPTDDEDDDLKGKIVCLSSLNLIDFAHAKFVESDEPDENLLNGIGNLINLFEHLVNKYTPNES